jgi:hypothetical protein
MRTFTRRLRRFCSASVLLVASAISAVAAAAPFELNMERVSSSSFGGSLTSSKTFFIPTVTIMVSAYGSVWAQSKNGSANAQAHGKFYVKGLDKELVQGLAKQLQEDLVAKMRAAGYTVFTYDDLKDLPVIANHGREAGDEKWAGLPTMTKDPLKYLIANPTDAQNFDRPITGPLFWLRSVALEKNLILIVPEITFSVPQLTGKTEKGYKTAEASLLMLPALKLQGAVIWTADAKGSVTILVQEHGQRPAKEVAGVSKKLSEDDTNFSSSWGRSSADFLFTLDQAAFSDGVTRVGTQINSMIVAQIQKAKK